MILAIDPGLASCGWAVVEQTSARLIALGVITTEQDKGIAPSTDRARRGIEIGRQLSELVDLHDCEHVAAESMLLFGNINAATCQVLCWGVLLGVAQVHGLGVVEVLAKDWQHAVTPGRKKIDYGKVEKALSKFVGAPLDRIERKLRTHALDAVGVGVFAARRPTTRVSA